MPKHVVLTEIILRAAKPPERGQMMLWDGVVRQFGLRVSQGGSKTFIVLLGSGRRHKIGRYPALSLAEARKRAKELLAKHTLARNQPEVITWDAAVARFLQQCSQKNRERTVRSYSRLLKKHLAFGSQIVGDITKGDLIRKTDALLETPGERNHLVAAAKIFFNWAVRSGYAEHSPCSGLVSAKRPPRERVLSDDELTAVLRVALEGTDNFSYIVALLLLTGQRRTEVGSLQWNWIDRSARTMTLPSTITKNKRTHTIPYSAMVERVLDQIPDRGVYLFPAAREHVNGKATTCFNGWPKGKEVFDRMCRIDAWTLHDLRRTFATNLAALRTPPHVVERLLNHVTGTISGVAAIYNRFSYMDEMREALVRRDVYIEKLLTSDGTKVAASRDEFAQQLGAIVR